MRGGDQGAARGFVEPAALDADEAVLHQVDAADGVARADFVQQFDDLYRFQRHTVYGDGLAFDEADLHHFFAVGRFLRRAGHHPGAGQGRVVGVLELAALVADVPKVAVAGVDFFPAGGDGDAVLSQRSRGSLRAISAPTRATGAMTLRSGASAW